MSAHIISSDNVSAFEQFNYDFSCFVFALKLLVDCQAEYCSSSSWQQLLFRIYSLLDQCCTDFSVLENCIRKGIDINSEDRSVSYPPLDSDS